MVAIEERELLLQLRDSATRDAAFARLVRSYQRMLYFHIRRMVIVHEDADDVLQNTLVKAWRNIDKFRADSALKTWLYRIATNEALTFLNRKKKASYTGVEDYRMTYVTAYGRDVIWKAKRFRCACRKLF